MIDLKQLGYEQLAALLANVISCMHQLKYEEGKINIELSAKNLTKRDKIEI